MCCYMRCALVCLPARAQIDRMISTCHVGCRLTSGVGGKGRRFKGSELKLIELVPCLDVQSLTEVVEKPLYCFDVIYL